jgi:hypothetical protein
MKSVWYNKGKDLDSLGKPCYVDPDIWIEEGIDDVCDGDICCRKRNGWKNCPYGGKFVVTPEVLARRKPLNQEDL